MKIGKYYIKINKNINKVREDLIRMTRIKGSSISKHVFDVFWGNINEYSFKFYCKNRFQNPELHGQLIEDNENKTLIKINIVISFFDSIVIVILLIFAFYMLIYKIIPEWSENIQLNIFIIFLLFGIPIIRFCIFLYYANDMIKYFKLYNKGYYQ
jgi:hypothetical protein